MTESNRRIGLMTGREWSWPPAFIAEVHRIAGSGPNPVEVEYVHIGAPGIDDPLRYDVIVDRISAEVPMYRTWLKHCVMSGVHVVNDPFVLTSADLYHGASLVRSFGIATPRTVLLPNHSYAPGMAHSDSLRNLDYPLDWDAVVAHVGLPLVLKHAHGTSGHDAHVCHSTDELIDRYDRTEQATMVVQEFIRWDQFVRVLCVGRRDALAMRYDPGERRHHDDPAYLPDNVRNQLEQDSLRIARALRHDLTTVEWAIRDGVPFVIDMLNAVPDLDADSLGARPFGWVVKRTAAFCVEVARASERRLRADV